MLSSLLQWHWNQKDRLRLKLKIEEIDYKAFHKFQDSWLVLTGNGVGDEVSPSHCHGGESTSNLVEIKNGRGHKQSQKRKMESEVEVSVQYNFILLQFPLWYWHLWSSETKIVGVVSRSGRSNQ